MQGIGRHIGYIVLLIVAFPLMAASQTLYSYQAGNWADASTWTTDPTGTVSTGSAVPGAGQSVVILNGRTVTLNANVATTGLNITINTGGTLDQAGNSFTSTVASLSGGGTFMLSGASFPTVTSNTFVNAGNGTVTYYGSSNYTISTSQTTYNNLTFEGTAIKSLNATLTINGNLTVSAGTFRIGTTTTARSLTIYGNVNVASGASITVNSAAAVHAWYLNGSLYNEGTIDLTNAANFAAATTLGGMTTEFNGAADDTVYSRSTGSTTFYEFIVDKGVDRTFILHALCDAGATMNFVSNNETLDLDNGTLRLGDNITISQLNGGTNYDISISGDDDAGLWVDGASVTNLGPIVVYGLLRITSGTFTQTGGSQGVIVSRDQGDITIEGGTVNVRQFRVSSTSTTHTGTFTMTGGTLNVNGPSSSVTDYSIFSWPYPGNVFIMTGGTINISGVTQSGAANGGGILIGATSYTVTGGTWNVTMPNVADDFIINSSVPFWDLNLNEAGATALEFEIAAQAHNIGGITSPVAARPLVVLNDLTVNSSFGTTLNMNGNNLQVYGDLTFASGVTYNTGTNTTILSPASGSVTATLNNTSPTFSSLTISAGSGATVQLAGNNPTISATLTIASGTFNDGGRTVTVQNTVSNSGTHAGSGVITLTNPSGAITLSGTGGQYENLTLNDADGATYSCSSCTVDGTLRLSSGVLNLGTNNLTVSSDGTIVNGSGSSGFSDFTTANMIITAGNTGDGGLGRAVSGGGGTQTLLFPLGLSGKYTPARASVTPNSSAGGTIIIRAVDASHPSVGSPTSLLTYYWRQTSTGFSTAPSSKFAYQYDAADISGTEAQLTSGVIGSGFSWLTNASTADVDDTNNRVFYPDDDSGSAGNTTTLTSGDFTAANAFTNPQVFYSRNATAGVSEVDWNTTSTWSLTAHSGSDGGLTPSSGNPVIIASGHQVTTSSTSRQSGSLSLSGTLNIGTGTGANFGTVSGTGTLRISTGGFPLGDYTSFLSTSGGTVEYYRNGANFTLPTSPTTYNNLVLSTFGGATGTLTFPAVSFTTLGNFTLGRTDNAGVLTINTSATSAYSISVNGDMIFNGHATNTTTLNIVSGGNQAFDIDGDLTINANSTFRVATSGANQTHTFSLGSNTADTGNLTNNGVLDFYSTGGGTRVCNITFTGSADATVSGTGATMDFNTLTVNKGSSQTPTLTYTHSNFTIQGGTTVAGLTITNGTFYLNAARTLTLATADFTIPSTGALRNNGGTISMNGAAGVDLLLEGMLRLDSGTINIGTGANNNSIEYSPTGSPTIMVTGGTLNVNGHIRRETTSTSGSLIYEQSAGTVNLGVASASTTARGLFEVLNSGSRFTMSSGTIVFVRSQTGASDATTAALLIQADSLNVTGGTLQIGNASTPASQTFRINATNVLNNITISTTNSPVLRTVISPLEIDGTLTISTGGTFQANGLQFKIGGDFTNSGTFTSASNTTIFDGSSQVLTGSTSFYNLTIQSGTTTLALTTTVTVTNDLDIDSGATLADNGQTINVADDLFIDGTHSGSGSITLNGSAVQDITGTGSVANLTLSGSSGALLGSHFTISGTLTFGGASGSLNIDTYNLTLSSTSLSSVSGASASRYIRMNGNLADGGVTKAFAGSVAAGSFTWPVGVFDAYTPVAYTITTGATGGNVTMKCVNSIHPAATGAGSDYLNYYWSTTSSIVNLTSLTHAYTWTAGKEAGTNTNYVDARFNSALWTTGSTSNVNTGTRTVSFSNTDLSGDYTTGIATRFVNPTTYTSNVVSGNFETDASWTPNPGTGSGPPDGSIIIISSGHNITVTTNTNVMSSLTINGTGILTLGTTSGHNWGTVTGTGTIRISSTTVVFPGGDYSAFTGTSGGTFEYNGGNQTLPPQTVYYNLIITGGGSATKSLPAVNITVRNLLRIDASTNFNGNSRTINVEGTWTNNSSTSAYTPGASGTVAFNGTAAQLIDGSAGTTFRNLTVNNTADVNLDQDISVDGTLTFTAGDLNSITGTYGSHVVTLGTSATVSGESNAGYLKGDVRVTRTVGTGSSTFGGIGLTIAAGADNIGSVTVKRVAGVSEAVPAGESGTLLRRWVITSASPPSSGRSVTFQWLPADDNGNDLTSIQFARRATEGSGAFTFVGSTNNVPNTTPRSVTLSTTSFSEWGAGGSGSSLPITLTYFRVTDAGGYPHLEWETATETNNFGFYVERRMTAGADAPAEPSESSWKRLSVFFEGRLQSLEPVTYDWNDSELHIAGTYEYRLVQYDYDGVQSVFGPVTYVFGAPESTQMLAPYPNPFNPATTIRYLLQSPSRVSLRVYDVLGREVAVLVNAQQAAGSYQMVFDARGFASGVYFVRLQTGTSSNIRKITLLR
jgi:hypothetical protein